MSGQRADAVPGAVVPVAAVACAIIAGRISGPGKGRAGRGLTAACPAVEGRADVRAGLVRGGKVSAMAPDPQSLQAELRRPEDRLAAVATAGRPGGAVLAPRPGRSTLDLAPGDGVAPTRSPGSQGALPRRTVSGAGKETAP